MSNIASVTSFNRFLPSTLGFDRIFDALDHVTEANNFPPVNIIREDENQYSLEVALAGYGENDVEVIAEQNKLKIVGKKTEDQRNYLVKGIATRAFTRTFVLVDTLVVRDAFLKDGILKIKLENVIPEEQKPRKIAITREV